MNHQKRSSCRICDGSRLRPFLSLGPQPPANAFPADPSGFGDEESYPLDVYFCDDCSLVQLVDVIDPGALFRNYLYLTGVSETMLRHFRTYADTVAAWSHLAHTDLVVEIGSNDGSLLASFQRLGARVVGVEPASNVAAVARGQGMETIEKFFTRDVARDILATHGPAKIIAANNVLAHVDEPVAVLEGCRDLLDPNGAIVVEVPSLGNLVKGMEYSTIYHEHLSYYSLTTLGTLFERAGLKLTRAEQVPVHGGSLRVYARHQEYAHDKKAAEELARMMENEAAAKLTSFDSLAAFSEAVPRNRSLLRNLVDDLRSAGKTIAGYGAPAKGTVLLNYCGFTPHDIPFVVDKSNWKVGRYVPGVHILVKSPEALTQSAPDYLLILAWNLQDEIREQQAEYHRRGGRFIIPVPEPCIV